MLYSCDPPHPPPGTGPQCDCFNGAGRGRQRIPRIHSVTQDRSSPAWAHVLATIDEAILDGREELDPLAGLSGPARTEIVTLPESIGRLTKLRRLKLYSSHLVRLPPEIGEMRSLEYLDVYTSYRLHFLPFELAHCGALNNSRMSTRALYGNFKNRGHFPDLKHQLNASVLAGMAPALCSVCRGPNDQERVITRWTTLRLGTDDIPLLVHACSLPCIQSLPKPPDDYLQKAHTGGPQAQPPPR